MPTALQTPIRRNDKATKVGPKRYRKQLVPTGTVEKGGRKLNFTVKGEAKGPDSIDLAEVAKNFTAGAMDQVPFLLANEKNEHHADPEKMRGEVTALEVQPDGLYGIVELSDDGAELVSKNPKLGVSVRIGQDRPQGNVLEHVLGTLDPVAQGMKPWEAIDLARPASGVTFVDLSEGEYTSENVSTEALSPEDVTALKALATRLGSKDGAEREDTDPVEDAEVEAVVEEFLKNSETEPAAAALSEDERKRIELAESQAKDASDRAARLEADLAKERFEARRSELLHAGVPPAIVNLAEPILARPGDAKIELSNGGSVDARDVVEKILDEARGTIDLSERGRSVAEENSQEAEAKRLAEEWVKSGG